MTPPIHHWGAVIDALAQTMLHFAWQGLVLWLVALCVLYAARAMAPQSRYAIYCGMLALLAVCPLITFALEFESPLPGPSYSGQSSPSEAAVEFAARRAVDQPIPAPWASATTAFVSRFERAQVWLVAIWLAGSAIFAMRLAIGTIGVATIRARRQPLPRPSEVASLVDRILGQLAFRRPPGVYVVDRLSQAMAIGLAKPVVLLPASWLCEMPPAVLETVIAHELAHLRRWDLAINYFQRVMECALFFHPVVWWCSRRLRQEREICCDALAVRVVGNRAAYAKALTYLADQRIASTEPLLAAGIGGPKMVLLARIRQVLDPAHRKPGRFYGTTCAASGAAAASILWLTGIAMFYAPAGSDGVDQKATAAAANAPAVQAPPKIGEVKSIESIEPQTARFMFGATKSPPGDAPSEHNKVTLPDYTIEPPDVLFIEALRVVPKAPYHIQSTDVLKIQVAGGFPTGPTGGGPSGDQYLVASSGRVDVGPLYGGKVAVAALTEDEAAEAIRKVLSEHLEEPRVSVEMAQSASLQPITGEHLVGPDGRVSLGMYGLVKVSGMTLEEAKAAIDAHLSEVLDNPDVSVSVFAYNSKVYYVITEGNDGDTVDRIPVTGNETVLDALSQANNARDLSCKNIFVARPSPGGSGDDTILPVNWKEITGGGDTTTNYQIFPGDRIFIIDDADTRAEFEVPVPGRDRVFRSPLGKPAGY